MSLETRTTVSTSILPSHSFHRPGFSLPWWFGLVAIRVLIAEIFLNRNLPNHNDNLDDQSDEEKNK